MPVADSDAPALRADGTLKDASEMQWEYSPSRPSAQLPPYPSSLTDPANTVHVQPFKWLQPQTGPAGTSQSTSTRKRTAGETEDQPNNNNNKKDDDKKKDDKKKLANAQSAAKRKLDRPAKKGLGTSIDRILAKPSLSLSDASVHSSELEGEEDDDGQDDDSAANVVAEDQDSASRAKRGEGYRDVDTIFTMVDGDVPEKGRICTICR